MVTVVNDRFLVVLLMAIGAIMLPMALPIPIPLLLLFWVAWAWRLLGVWRVAILPKPWLVLWVLGFAIVLLVKQYRGGWEPATGVSVFVVAVTVKLLDSNTRQQAYLLVCLALLLTGCLLLFEPSWLLCVYAGVLCWLLLTVLLELTMTQTALVSLLGLSAKMLLKALPLALVIFVLFPRFHVPAWLALQNQHRAQSGLGEVLEPGEVSQLVLSNELVFRAKFLADRPATTGLYWRGPVYSLTNGRQWRIIDNDISIKYQDIIAHDRQAYHYSLLLQGNMHGWVYALDMPMEYDPSLWRNGNYQLMGRNNNNPAEYRITSYPHYNTGYITKTEYRQNLQLPSAVPPRITDLVNRLRQGSTQPTEYIDKVLAFFQQQGFSYTLQPPLMGKQPIERFLFDEKRGFCSHYATAFVYLMRAAAIPARVVAGYQGGKFNPVGQFVEVRQSDAHVWAEVWLADKGWLRVDPTLSVAPRGAGQQGPSADNAAAAKPLAVSGEATEPPLVQWTKLLWNDLDYHWQKSVLSFGENNQSHIFQRLGLHYTKTAGLLAVILAATLAVLVAIFATPSPLTAVLPELRQYRKFCRKMAKLGLARQSGEGAMAFAARTATSHPELAAKVNEISQLFIKLHYQRCADGGDLQQLKKLVRSFSGKP